jgi:hypothetical protein
MGSPSLEGSPITAISNLPSAAEPDGSAPGQRTANGVSAGEELAVGAAETAAAENGVSEGGGSSDGTGPSGRACEQAAENSMQTQYDSVWIRNSPPPASMPPFRKPAA